MPQEDVWEPPRGWQRNFLGYRERFVDDCVVGLRGGTVTLRIAQAPSASSALKRRAKGNLDKTSDPALTGTTVWDGALVLSHFLTETDALPRHASTQGAPQVSNTQPTLNGQPATCGINESTPNREAHNASATSGSASESTSTGVVRESYPASAGRVIHPTVPVRGSSIVAERNEGVGERNVGVGKRRLAIATGNRETTTASPVKGHPTAAARGTNSSTRGKSPTTGSDGMNTPLPATGHSSTSGGSPTTGSDGVNTPLPATGHSASVIQKMHLAPPVMTGITGGGAATAVKDIDVATAVSSLHRMAVNPLPTCIELGAGTGTVSLSLLACRLVRHVTITDLADCVPHIQANVAHNSKVVNVRQVSVCPLQWGNSEDVARLTPCKPPFDLVVGSDLIYYSYSKETPHSLLLVQTLKQLCGARSVVYLALGLQHNPEEVEHFLQMASEWFSVERVQHLVPEEWRIHDTLVVHMKLLCGDSNADDVVVSST